jgi:hypothetical protein
MKTRAQLDLFRPLPPPDPMRGVVVRLPSPCRCGAAGAMIAEGAGPHIASLVCTKCETRRGWLPHKAHTFLSGILNTFGRPIEPITIRRRGARRNIRRRSGHV